MTAEESVCRLADANLQLAVLQKESAEVQRRFAQVKDRNLPAVLWDQVKRVKDPLEAGQIVAHYVLSGRCDCLTQVGQDYSTRLLVKDVGFIPGAYGYSVASKAREFLVGRHYWLDSIEQTSSGLQRRVRISSVGPCPNHQDKQVVVWCAL